MKTREGIFRKITASVTACTKSHFNNALGIEFLSHFSSHGDIDALVLRNLTAIIGLGGSVNFLVAFSFDSVLAARLLEIEIEGLRIDDSEREQMLFNTAAETANIVLGHASTDLVQKGSDVDMSPPLVLEAAGGRLRCPKGAYFSSISLNTHYGWLDIDFITPKQLFGEKITEIVE